MKEFLLKELSYTSSCSSGPGGQHVNKTESRVTLQWNLETTEALTDEQKTLVRSRLRSKLTTEGELLMSCQSNRSQIRNKEEVTERFLELIEKLSKPPKKRKKTKPSRASIERRLKRKKVRGERKQSRGKPGEDD